MNVFFHLVEIPFNRSILIKNPCVQCQQKKKTRKCYISHVSYYCNVSLKNDR